ncbi:DUF3445 domain-containing protein [Microcoleus sp. FACHB-1515]|uniref:heme-dependent oxidative N-demethylase family protein n=1 Tax=Cyanophyceae TaxID=3028117 RepID=UPI0016875969|nr:DUF3445 domain-containing protein [Microcoleus sp. FACHB-1515]MBD2091726.1 DUF3445 domain-containing protein [Microcoleus sp. FACHB-1515]
MLRSIPFSRKPGWWLTLRLKPLALSEWIEIDENFASQLQLKAELLRDRHDEMFAALPGSIAAQQEVLDLLIDHLLNYYPQHYQRQSGHLLNCATGEVWHLADFAEKPLDLAGRLVQEDWCVLLPQAGEHVLVAGSVCFPSRWRLQDKLGRSLLGVHAPVPGYAEKLARPVDTVFDRLRANHPSIRFNWSIVDTPDLCLMTAHGEAGVDPTIALENAGDKLWLRVERQTLRRLPQTNGILFGIRTSIAPLWQVKADRSMALQLADALEQMPVEGRAYKSLLPIQSVLLAYLRG